MDPSTSRPETGPVDGGECGGGEARGVSGYRHTKKDRYTFKETTEGNVKLILSLRRVPDVPKVSNRRCTRKEGFGELRGAGLGTV